ncbi:MAG: extracellular solute-binding protein [Deltaproteobacteria bacterium]|nr:extracellular solute-binding protein [Deltaproteobacteria bacterium]
MNSNIDSFKRLALLGTFLWIALLVVSSLLYGASDPKIIEAAKGERELTVWTTSDLRQVTKIVESFEKKYPFLKVKLYRTGTAPLHNKIITEALAGKHNWDVSNSTLQTHDLFERKMVAKYKSPQTSMLLDPEMLNKEGHWTAIYVVPFVLGFNTNLVKAQDAPKTYDDLLSSKWKDKMISIDSEGYELLQGLSTAWGKEKAVAFLKKLAAQDPVSRRGNSLRVELATGGEFPVLIAMASPIQRAASKGAPIDWVPLEPVPVTSMAIMLAEHAPHPNAGKLYIDFILSRDGQEILRSEQRIPVRKDVEADPPRLIKGYKRVMLHPMKASEYEEIVRLYREIFNIR